MRLTTLRFSCGRNARRSEFYGPLSASGGPHRPEPGVLRARQLQPLVRLLPRLGGGAARLPFAASP